MAYSLMEWSYFSITLGVVLSGFFTLLCWNIRRSRCVDIYICGSGCTRKLMTSEEMEADTQQTMDVLHANEQRRASNAGSDVSDHDETHPNQEVAKPCACKCHDGNHQV